MKFFVFGFLVTLPRFVAQECQPACAPGHGVCISGKCFCRDPWGGDDCTKTTHPQGPAVAQVQGVATESGQQVATGSDTPELRSEVGDLQNQMSYLAPPLAEDSWQSGPAKQKDQEPVAPVEPKDVMRSSEAQQDIADLSLTSPSQGFLAANTPPAITGTGAKRSLMQWSSAGQSNDEDTVMLPEQSVSRSGDKAEPAPDTVLEPADIAVTRSAEVSRSGGVVAAMRKPVSMASITGKFESGKLRSHLHEVIQERDQARHESEIAKENVNSVKHQRDELLREVEELKKEEELKIEEEDEHHGGDHRSHSMLAEKVGLHTADASVWGKIGLFIPLVLGLCMISICVHSCGAFIYQHADAFAYISFFALTTVAYGSWVVVSLSGIIDEYIKMAVFVVYAVFMIMVIIGMIVFLLKRYCMHSEHSCYAGFKGIMKSYRTMVRKIEGMEDQISTLVKSCGHADYDSSETEPDDNMPKMNLKVTILKATGLKNADMWGKTKAYCSFVVRGKSTCGWKKTHALLLKKGEGAAHMSVVEWNVAGVLKNIECDDCLKFKVWDDDCGVGDDLLGRAFGGMLISTKQIELLKTGPISKTIKLKGDYIQKDGALTFQVELAGHFQGSKFVASGEKDDPLVKCRRGKDFEQALEEGCEEAAAKEKKSWLKCGC